MKCNKHQRFSALCRECRAEYPEITKTEVKPAGSVPLPATG